jgi:hypothetical protein
MLTFINSPAIQFYVSDLSKHLPGAKRRFSGMWGQRKPMQSNFRFFGVGQSVHHLASHSPLGAKWKAIEKRLLRRYMKPWKMVRLGICGDERF